MARDRYLGVDDPRDPPAPADAHPDPSPPDGPPSESDTDRCLRVMREVFLGQPGPHDLPSGVAEVERRLKGGGK